MLQSNERIIRHKVGLLNLAEELGNVSQACKVMGMSRDTFYRYRDAVENGDSHSVTSYCSSSFLSSLPIAVNGNASSTTIERGSL